MSRSHRLIIALAAILPLPALAWNAQGHQEVGAIADRLLAGTRAEQQVHAILGERNLQTVSVWADCAKATKSADDVHFDYQDNPKFLECAVFNTPEDKARFESFVMRNWKQCGTARGTEYCHNQYHYADIASLRDGYDAAGVGANDHDVVHAINAAIAVLQDEAPKPPFSFADEREALMLLTHYVGDIHQPLHVTALYLDAKGNVVDPDKSGYKPGQNTAGGNNIVEDKKLLHGEWDAPPANLMADGAPAPELMQMARAVTPTAGNMAAWSTAWAGDSVKLAPQTFGGLHFTMRPAPAGTNVDYSPEKWDVAGIDSAYQARADKIKQEQIAKAGARLAQLLEAIWPQDPPAPAATK